MDNTSDTLAQAATGALTLSVPGKRWNGWALLIVGLTGIFSFVVTQTVVLILIFLKAHPDVLRVGAMPPGVLSQPAIINLLTAKNLWYISVSSELVLVLSTLVLARVAFGATAKTLGLGKVPGLQWILFGIGMGIVLVIASGLVEAAQNKILGYHPPQFQAQVLLKHHGLADFLLDFSAVSIAAPFAEETFFRGLIFTGLAQRMTPVYAGIVSAAFFGVAHFEKWSLLPIFVIGLGLAYAYYRTRSLWVSMAAHATVNTVSLLIAYLFPQLVK